MIIIEIDLDSRLMLYDKVLCNLISKVNKDYLPWLKGGFGTRCVLSFGWLLVAVKQVMFACAI